MGPVVRLVGKGIGIASEAIAHHKEKKAAEKLSGPTSTSDDTPMRSSIAIESSSRHHTNDDVPPYDPPEYDTLDPSSAHYGLVETADEQHARDLITKGEAVPYDADLRDMDPNEATHFDDSPDDDEATWDLDEAVASHHTPSTGIDELDDAKDKPDVRKVIQKFLDAHPTPSIAPPIKPLPCPVIIPQRRPHSKGRGFVRAYAPVLESCGIDQGMFMDFLTAFHKASQASPVFEVIFVVGHLIGYAPTLTAMAISIPVQVGAGAAIVTQSRYRYIRFGPFNNDLPTLTPSKQDKRFSDRDKQLHLPPTRCSYVLSLSCIFIHFMHCPPRLILASLPRSIPRLP